MKSLRRPRRNRTTKSRKREDPRQADRELMSDTGQELREARERKQVTIAQAAEATRIKTSHLEAMERNCFDGFAAPIYARGFIRSYAEYLGLDPQPLLEDYQRRSGPTAPPVQLPSKVFRSSAVPPEPAPETALPAEPEFQLTSDPPDAATPVPEPQALPPAATPAPAPNPPTPELDLFSIPAPTPRPAPAPIPAVEPDVVRIPPAGEPAIPAPAVEPPARTGRDIRTDASASREPESAPETGSEEVKSFKPLIYGAVAALVIGLLLSRCADRKPAAASKPEADVLLIEPPQEPFFPVRRAPPAAQPAP